MTNEEFKEMFFKVAADYDYDFVSRAKELAENDPSYIPFLHKKCKKFTERHCIDEHDSLHHFMGRADIFPKKSGRKK